MASGEATQVSIAGPAVLQELARARWPADTASLLGRWAAEAAALRPQARTMHERIQPVLTEREQEVLAHLASGDSNKLIARSLDLSPHTVKRHVANILDKLGASTRGQAAAWHRRHAG